MADIIESNPEILRGNLIFKSIRISVRQISEINLLELIKRQIISYKEFQKMFAELVHNKQLKHNDILFFESKAL
ncbi:MAG: hypothetical protein ACFFG0_13320 [Candidatus Thorarchaeota archaeon]